MNLTNTYVGHSGVTYFFEYCDADTFLHLDKSACTQIYAVCFVGEQIVIVYGGKKGTWGLVGGTIEEGETFEETLRREIQEESNMEVLSFLPVGYQKVTDARDGSFVYQLRYMCTARPYGPFASDPAGTVTAIKLIDPKDIKHYFDWGNIGDRIIERAMELKHRLG